MSQRRILKRGGDIRDTQLRADLAASSTTWILVAGEGGTASLCAGLGLGSEADRSKCEAYLARKLHARASDPSATARDASGSLMDGVVAINVVLPLQSPRPDLAGRISTSTFHGVCSSSRPYCFSFYLQKTSTQRYLSWGKKGR